MRGLWRLNFHTIFNSHVLSFVQILYFGIKFFTKSTILPINQKSICFEVEILNKKCPQHDPNTLHPFC